jgi:hypothetical protein
MIALLLVSIVVITALITLTPKHPEALKNPNASYAYQNNIQPFWISPQAQNLWTEPAMRLCHSRVAAACDSLPLDQKIGCVQQNLMECTSSNQAVISRMCKQNIPDTICNKHCSHPASQRCKNCQLYVQRFGVCSKPDLSI